MKAGKKIQRRLDDRQGDYERMLRSTDHESKVRSRMENGGYTRPGSRKK